METVNFADNVKKEDGGVVLKQQRKPRVFLKNLSEEERLQKMADFAQARRDYIKRYYKENEAYRTACKARTRVFAKSYYHSNAEYKQKVIERSKMASKVVKDKTSTDCKDETI